MAAIYLLSLENPVFAVYSLCSAILLLKTLSMAFLTARQRFKYKNFSFPEDNVKQGIQREVKPTHPEVERVRRVHQNDLENIFPFVFIGLFYVSTNPSATLAKSLLIFFTVCRLVHTVVFMNAIPQPARGLTFAVSTLVNIVMAVSVIVHVLPHCF